MVGWNQTFKDTVEETPVELQSLYNFNVKTYFPPPAQSHVISPPIKWEAFAFEKNKIEKQNRRNNFLNIYNKNNYPEGAPWEQI